MRIANFLLMVTVLAAWTALQAFGESRIASANIDAGDVLDEAPPAFELTFERPVVLEEVTLVSGSDEVLPLGFTPLQELRSAFSVSLPELHDGDYVLSWQATDEAGTVIRDLVDFVVIGYHDHSDHTH